MSEKRARWHWLMGSDNLRASYRRCLLLCRAGDAVLLLGQHVYLLAQADVSCADGVRLYALEESVRAAGLIARVPPCINLIAWPEVLELLEQQYPLQQTWR